MNVRRPSRRDLLRAAGGAAAIFPFLGGRGHAALPATPRLVLLMQSNGTSQANFWPTPAPPTPTATMAPATPGPGLGSPILQPLAGDPLLAGSLTVVKGLTNEHGGAGNGHDHGFCGLYSGYRSVGSFNDPWGSGISIDQDLRQKLAFAEPFPTLHCGVLASDTPPFKTHRRSFSYRGPKQQIPTEIDPYRLYARYFGAGPRAGGEGVAVAKERLARRQTVLDAVRGDLAALRPRLGAFDRQKLDDHAGAVRELEQRLAATLTPDPMRPARCGGVSAPLAAGMGLDLRHEDHVPRLIPLMFDFMALALSCQLTRIVTFQFGHGGEKWYFRWLGINENSHDDIAHRDSGTDAAVTAKVVAMNRWYAEQVAQLGRAMARMPDGEGQTLLDNSLIVWGNELATGPHGMNDLPLVTLGRAAGRWPAAGRLVDAGPQDYHRLGTSLLNLMGVPAQGFGEVPDCGPLVGLS